MQASQQSRYHPSSFQGAGTVASSRIKLQCALPLLDVRTYPSSSAAGAVRRSAAFAGKFRSNRAQLVANHNELPGKRSKLQFPVTRASHLTKASRDEVSVIAQAPSKNDFPCDYLQRADGAIAAVGRFSLAAIRHADYLPSSALARCVSGHVPRERCRHQRSA